MSDMCWGGFVLYPQCGVTSLCVCLDTEREGTDERVTCRKAHVGGHDVAIRWDWLIGFKLEFLSTF